jgi:hypothetical protein
VLGMFLAGVSRYRARQLPSGRFAMFAMCSSAWGQMARFCCHSPTAQAVTSLA